MAAGQIPDTLRRPGAPAVTDDGTLARIEMPQPPSVGLGNITGSGPLSAETAPPGERPKRSAG